ncbi:hypothetical protein EXIGLDRAFT_724398 [Exidia glandulosa HHB12029]|uniref:Uncharacterized protein n=1 Tax=Exidia glandulosa HHB12029 TaxID=1314781 RepID=A0A165EFJ8_EXIGL|nr:hypothetical protein EXIGLDRAFT_724398 [Exidia glandulosa HHB12029]
MSRSSTNAQQPGHARVAFADLSGLDLLAAAAQVEYDEPEESSSSSDEEPDPRKRRIKKLCPPGAELVPPTPNRPNKLEFRWPDGGCFRYGEEEHSSPLFPDNPPPLPNRSPTPSASPHNAAPLPALAALRTPSPGPDPASPTSPLDGVRRKRGRPVGAQTTGVPLSEFFGPSTPRAKKARTTAKEKENQKKAPARKGATRIPKTRAPAERHRRNLSLESDDNPFTPTTRTPALSHKSQEPPADELQFTATVGIRQPPKTVPPTTRKGTAKTVLQDPIWGVPFSVSAACDFEGLMKLVITGLPPPATAEAIDLSSLTWAVRATRSKQPQPLCNQATFNFFQTTIRAMALKGAIWVEFSVNPRTVFQQQQQQQQWSSHVSQPQAAPVLPLSAKPPTVFDFSTVPRMSVDPVLPANLPALQTLSAPQPPTGTPVQGNISWDDQVAVEVSALRAIHNKPCILHRGIICIVIRGLHFDSANDKRMIVWAGCRLNGSHTRDLPPLGAEGWKATDAFDVMKPAQTAQPSRGRDTQDSDLGKSIQNMLGMQLLMMQRNMMSPQFDMQSIHPYANDPRSLQPYTPNTASTSASARPPSPDLRPSSPPPIEPGTSVQEYLSSAGVAPADILRLKSMGYSVGQSLATVPSAKWQSAGFTSLQWLDVKDKLSSLGRNLKAIHRL